jgi:hypothetical protein
MSDPETLAGRLVDELDAGAAVTTATRQRLFAALVRLYAAGAGPAAEPPLGREEVATEDVLVTAAEMLRAAGVTSFELATLFNV